MLASDFWSRFMTSVVAVSLTLASPYTFRIVKSFLGWALRSGDWRRAEMSITHAREPSSSSSQSAEFETPLLCEQTTHYGATRTSGVGGESICREGQDSDSEDDRTGEDSSENDGSNPVSALVPYEEGFSETSRPLQNPPNRPNRPVTPRDPSPRTESTLRACAGNAQEQALSEGFVKGLVDLLDESESSREFVWGSMKYVVRGGKKWGEVSAVILLITTLLFGDSRHPICQYRFGQNRAIFLTTL